MPRDDEIALSLLDLSTGNAIRTRAIASGSRGFNAMATLSRTLPDEVADGQSWIIAGLLRSHGPQDVAWTHNLQI